MRAVSRASAKPEGALHVVARRVLAAAAAVLAGCGGAGRAVETASLEGPADDTRAVEPQEVSSAHAGRGLGAKLDVGRALECIRDAPLAFDGHLDRNPIVKDCYRLQWISKDDPDLRASALKAFRDRVAAIDDLVCGELVVLLRMMRMWPELKEARERAARRARDRCSERPEMLWWLVACLREGDDLPDLALRICSEQSRSESEVWGRSTQFTYTAWGRWMAERGVEVDEETERRVLHSPVDFRDTPALMVLLSKPRTRRSAMEALLRRHSDAHPMGQTAFGMVMRFAFQQSRQDLQDALIAVGARDDLGPEAVRHLWLGSYRTHPLAVAERVREYVSDLASGRQVLNEYVVMDVEGPK